MILADSRFWLNYSAAPPLTGPYPPSVFAQPIIENSTAGSPGLLQSYTDMYRHGITPPRIGNVLDPWKGKVAYNILYCDGHVATQNNGKEAYQTIRMKFPK
jgi:prepilin-type processing-associated H-X9-DG protein